MNELSRISRSLDDSTGFTVGEFMTMVALGAFSDVRAELVDGEIRKLAPAGIEHGESNATLLIKLYEAYRTTNFRIAVDLAVVNDHNTVRGADVAIVHPTAPSSGAIEGKDAILLVEIADTTLAKDLGVKASEYAAVGVPDYWVVDVNAHAVHAMSLPRPDGYETRIVYRFGEAIPVPGTDRTITLD